MTIVSEPHPDHPGWFTWNVSEPGRFNDFLGTIIVRGEAGGRGRVRMLAPGRQHSNFLESIHGGILLGFADVALFAGGTACGLAGIAGGQTLDCGMQFLSPGRLDVALDAVVEVLRETGRFAFLRGTIEQEGTLVAAFTGTLRKPSVPRPAAR